MMVSEWVTLLLDSQNSMQEKQQALANGLARFPDQSSRLRWILGLIVVPGEEPDRRRLVSVIVEFMGLRKSIRRERSPQYREMAGSMRSLSPGTPILINKRGGAEVMKLIEVEKTRFVAESANGRYSVHVSAFAGLPDQSEDENLAEAFLDALQEQGKSKYLTHKGRDDDESSCSHAERSDLGSLSGRVEPDSDRPGTV